MLILQIDECMIFLILVLITSMNYKLPYICIQEAEKKAGHSTLLADKPDLYEILVDDVKPEKWEEYLKHKGKIYI